MSADKPGSYKGLTEARKERIKNIMIDSSR